MLIKVIVWQWFYDNKLQVNGSKTQEIEFLINSSQSTEG